MPGHAFQELIGRCRTFSTAAKFADDFTLNHCLCKDWIKEDPVHHCTGNMSMPFYDNILMVVRQNGMRTGQGRSLSANKLLPLLLRLLRKNSMKLQNAGETLPVYQSVPVRKLPKNAECLDGLSVT
jgi:hypothetical protein